ncbi:DUF4168 domain-containing protein [Novosphingobium sp. YJ-S2-02]|uniref:DUF4168 domain-containing protein n=1 Tax=Novosphingobium aureum TaxID=2792964 RepID=A0A931HA43_9SPHN|nr:DUF4168 domain-containing protein [Novosphingobium aureum]MBH0111793.1 DUF4168 domain-containing protein [Novosphingobium aureum]
MNVTKLALAATATFGTLAGAGVAQAQSAPPAAAASADFSDQEVQQFATAAVSIQNIQKDTSATTEEKQSAMASAVQSSGLTPQKFNEIAAASRTDSALMQRIQTAAAAGNP